MKKIFAIFLFIISSATTIFADLNDYLIQAASSGNIERVKLLLEAGANPNAQDSEALIEAVCGGYTEIVQLLLTGEGEAKANPNAQNSEALIQAAWRGHTEIVKLLLTGEGEAKADPKARNSEALIQAAWRGHTEIVKLLLTAKADPKAQDSKALVQASSRGYNEIVQLLLTTKADPKAQDSQALIEATRGGYTGIVELLLQAKADPKAQDSEALVQASWKGHTEIVKLLLTGEVKADARAQNSEALISAARYGHTEIMELLLQAGADPKESFIYAVSSGEIKILQLLLVNADSNAQSQALIYAVKNAPEDKRTEIVELLLQAGADPNAQNSQALVDAASDGHTEIVELLLQAGADPKAQDSQALISAASDGHTEIVRLLLEGEVKADPKAQDSEALIMAAKWGYTEIVRLLLEGEVKADPNAQDSQALIMAARYGRIEIVKLLLQAGADPNAQNSQALIEAASEDRIEIVQLLLTAKADPNAQNSQALIEAARYGRIEIVKLLLTAKADPNAQNSEALIKASSRGYTEIINLLLKELNLFDRKVIKKMLLSGSHCLVKYLFDNVAEVKDAYLIGVGLNHTRGETTSNVLKILSNKIEAYENAYHVELSLEIAQDEDIMQYFSGFINPGALDNYPSSGKPFTLEEMPVDWRMYHEKVYQEILTMAKKYDIPYLGICAGAQHLILNSNGSLKEGGHGSSIKVNFIPGTIPHFLFLTEAEKSEALATCTLNPIELTDAYTAHRYAGYIENLGEGIKLAAVSQAGIPEAFSLGADKIGVQFHPEEGYDSSISGLNRYKEFFDNIFGIFDGYYRSMQYAKKMQIDRKVAKAAIRKVNQELLEHLENCADKNAVSNVTLWGKGYTIGQQSEENTISLLPGTTIEDIAITQDDENNWVIYAKDAEGKLTIQGHFDDKDTMSRLLRVAFADGTVIEWDTANREQSNISFPGEEWVNFKSKDASEH